MLLVRQLYWKGPIEVQVEKVDLNAELEVPAGVAKLLARAKQPLLATVSDAICSAEVADTSVALLIVDGKFVKLLEPGLHVFWKFQRVLKVEHVDRSVQTMEVSGQKKGQHRKTRNRTPWRCRFRGSSFVVLLTGPVRPAFGEAS